MTPNSDWTKKNYSIDNHYKTFTKQPELDIPNRVPNVEHDCTLMYTHWGQKLWLYPHLNAYSSRSLLLYYDMLNKIGKIIT